MTNAAGERQSAQAVVFGLGSMFNHSTQDQNVVWERDNEHRIITYRAWRDILAGEELCISYGSHLTFKDADTPVPVPPETELEQLNQIQID
jgi:SET domain-containing protein